MGWGQQNVGNMGSRDGGNRVESFEQGEDKGQETWGRLNQNKGDIKSHIEAHYFINKYILKKIKGDNLNDQKVSLPRTMGY